MKKALELIPQIGYNPARVGGGKRSEKDAQAVTDWTVGPTEEM